MNQKSGLLVWWAAVLVLTTQVYAENEFIEVVRSGDQTSAVRIEPAQVPGQSGISVVFKGTDDLHYYATPEAAPAPGLELKVKAVGQGVTFGEAIFPEYHYFDDPALGKIAVFVGDFSVFVPISETQEGSTKANAVVEISGITCTSKLCLPPFNKTLAATLDLSQWPAVSFLSSAEAVDVPVEPVAAAAASEPETASNHGTLAETLSGWQTTDSTQTAEDGSVAWYFLLAILAGISINIMPCVLPVIPLIIMRLVAQAKESSARRVGLGFSFCGGIVLFFAMFAALSVAVKLSTGASLDLNSLYRNATAVIILFLAIVFFALVLMDLLTLTLPSSVANKQGSGAGVAGSVGMGFFAGVLSTPCSGAILGAVLVWAQTQPLVVSSIALILMGVGMALPYAILVSVPSLLNFVPKPGTWMENFKKAGGFLLLLIAVKFTLTALPKERLIGVLMFGVIFSFAVWMWGSWVSFSTPKGRKWTIRLIALVLAVVSGVYLLPAVQESQIHWQKYDAAAVQKAIENDQPVLVKFTADWCTNCKIVEKNVFQLPEIAALIDQKGLVAFKADTTQSHYPAAKDLNAVFGEAGSVPLTVLLNPTDHRMTKLRGIFTPEEFKQAVAGQ